ncbi:hypothetical protein NECAME_04243 [Necator americanus]|uniref:Uncharacterized protein n=1 Tax=Necator americanus TaxID=51031 RepID=W2SW58_NECAM|nr:hypothetical protein NECAME_04243 [Necator americanus]ETN73850.1 hypothetical protein NECAME_04243 [Necator americanus]
MFVIEMQRTENRSDNQETIPICNYKHTVEECKGTNRNHKLTRVKFEKSRIAHIHTVDSSNADTSAAAWLHFGGFFTMD